MTNAIVKSFDTRIGVICGGDSPERAGSLASGTAVHKALVDAGFDATLIDLKGLDIAALASRIDVAFLAAHGPYGEDGRLQGTLETLQVAYTGSGVRPSAICMHKPTFKRLISREGIDTPKWIDYQPASSTRATWRNINVRLPGNQFFLKPAAGGGSMGAGIAQSYEDFIEITGAAGIDYGEMMAEEYVDGTSCSVGILDDGNAIRTLPVHSATTTRPFYDYDAKHDAALRTESCPADIPAELAGHLRSTALQAHRLVGAHGATRVDFNVTPSGRATLLEMNTLPGLSRTGNLAVMAKASGLSFAQLIIEICTSARVASSST